MAGFRIVVGGDDAGFDYKATLIKDLTADPRVSEVIDVGPKSSSDKTAYPHFAISAAEMVAQGKADRARENIPLPSDLRVFHATRVTDRRPLRSINMRHWLGRCYLGK